MSTPNIAKHLDRIGIDPPAGYKLAEELRVACNTTATANPVGDLETDLLAGKVTPKQAAARIADCARTLTEREKAREVARDLGPTFDRLANRALRDGAPALIEAMRPTFDQAVATIVDSTELLGTNPDDATVGRLGPTAALHWQQRKDATATLAAIHRVRLALEQVGYGSPQTVAWYLAECPDTPALAEAHQTFHAHGEGLTNLATHGYKLRLNLADEADQIANGARLATEAADQAARDAALAESKARTERYVNDWRALAPKTEEAKV